MASPALYGRFAQGVVPPPVLNLDASVGGSKRFTYLRVLCWRTPSERGSLVFGEATGVHAIPTASARRMTSEHRRGGRRRGVRLIWVASLSEAEEANRVS